MPLIKLGLGLLPPNLFVALRFTLASILILVFLRRKGWVDWTLLRARPIWIVGFVNAFGYVLQFQGQKFTTSSDAALIISTAALMIPVLSWARGNEKIGVRKGLGVLSGFLGASLVVTRGQSASFGQTQFLGDVLILGTAITIALVFIYSKDLVVRKGGRAVTGGMIFITSLLLALVIPLDQNASINLSLAAVFYVVFLAVVATVGAYYFLMKGLETVSPTVSSIILPIDDRRGCVISGNIRGPVQLLLGNRCSLDSRRCPTSIVLDLEKLGLLVGAARRTVGRIRVH